MLLGSGPVTEQGWRGFEPSYERALVEMQPELRQIAALPKFQTALAWQNHKALRLAAIPLLRQPVAQVRRNSRHRQREELVAGYWQRYCMKNDSIGFFGPIGWVRIDPARPTSFRPSAEFIESHEVFFESWAIDLLAAKLAAVDGMADWLPPRRVPYVAIDGQHVSMPGRPAKAVDPAAADVLRRCDGTKVARLLAQDVIATGLVSTIDEVYRILEDLRKRRWIVWTLELPLDPRPEVHLRDRLGAIGSDTLRDQAIAKLDRLEAARAQVDAAWFDSERLAPALDSLDTTYGEVTGEEPTHNEGKTYGGRTLVYHDARRALDLTFGNDILEALAPIELIFASAAWLTYSVGQELEQRIRALYAGLLARTSRSVDLGSLWFECMPLILKPGHDLVAKLVNELQARWAEILQLPHNVARTTYDSAALRSRVAAQFGAPHAGWQGARYISPDVMIAASDVEAIRRGDFQLVLSELHLALASYRHFCFVTQHPAPAELFACLDNDYPQPRLLPVLPKSNASRLTVRTNCALIRKDDYLVALYHHTADTNRPRLLMSSDLLVSDRQGRLSVQLASGEVFDVLECFSELLLDLVIDAFDIFAPNDHLPRVTIDRLVINRETWWFDARVLDFAAHRSEARRYLEARSWQQRTGLPKRIFVVSPLETKPFFVDFDSPIHINLLTKAIRAVRDAGSDSPLRITEMLPTTDQLWLTDTDGARYTSELRLVAVDQLPIDRSAGEHHAAGRGDTPSTHST